MRRIAFSLLAALMLASCGPLTQTPTTGTTSDSGSSQITFFGNKFGDYIMNVAQRMHNQGYEMGVESNYITFTNLPFEGRNWQHAAFYFNENKRLNKIEFRQGFQQQSGASALYKTLQKDLDSKYGSGQLVNGSLRYSANSQRSAASLSTHEAGTRGSSSNIWYCVLTFTE